jgi:hypothetical protein
VPRVLLFAGLEDGAAGKRRAREEVLLRIRLEFEAALTRRQVHTLEVPACEAIGNCKDQRL